MKKLLTFALALITAVNLTACVTLNKMPTQLPDDPSLSSAESTPAPSESTVTTDTESVLVSTTEHTPENRPENTDVLPVPNEPEVVSPSNDETGEKKLVKILEVNGNEILVSAVTKTFAGNFFVVYTDNSSFFGETGEEISIDALTPGTVIEISVPMSIDAISPAHFAVERIDVKYQGNDNYSFFMKILEYLYEEDSGINHEIDYISFDIDSEGLLSDGEEDALTWRFSSEKNVTPLEGDYEDLCEMGYINRNELYFENGIIMSIEVDDDTIAMSEDMPCSTGHFKFEASKWRSGLGAIFMDCKAEKINGVWSFEVESFAIA